jgi:ATP-dependent protease ClpP protease subunit
MQYVPDFQYVVDTNSDEPIMLLNGEIGGTGIDGPQFQAELLRLDAMGKKRIQVYINSVGGSVVDGMAIYNAILKTKTRCDTYNIGIAASIAAVIFQAGRKRVMSDFSVLMFHYASGGDAASLGALNAAMIIMIERSGMSKAAVKKMLNNGDTFLSAAQALALNLCDEIETSSDFNSKHGNSVQNSFSFINGKAVPRIFNSPNCLNLMDEIRSRTKSF